VAIAVVGAVALAMFVASTALGSVGDVLAAAVAAIGLQIAFYYGLAGIAAVVAYRRTLLTSVRDFVLGGAWPLLGALFMLWIFFESLGELSAASTGIGLGGLAVGLVPMIVYWRQGSAYYRPARLDAALAMETQESYANSPSRHPDHADKSLATDF
jgi:hypothetical protein